MFKKVIYFILRNFYTFIALLMLLLIITGYAKPYDNESTSVMLLIIFIVQVSNTKRIDKLHKIKEKNGS
jgi:hypothetical protein